MTFADLHATLAYAVCADQQCDVHVVDPSGIDRNVTNTPGAGTEEHQPDLSPDGSRIAFRCPHDRAQAENPDNDDICRINVDGSGRKNLTALRHPAHPVCEALYWIVRPDQQPGANDKCPPRHTVLDGLLAKRL